MQLTRAFAARLETVGELFTFLWVRKRWWLAPILVILLLTVLLLFFVQSSVLSRFYPFF